MQRLFLAIWIGFSSMGVAATLFDRAQESYDNATRPPLSDFAKDALWAGRVIFAKIPDVTWANAFATYAENDPFLPASIYMVYLSSQNNVDYYSKLTPEAARTLHEQTRASISQYTPVEEMGDPFLNALVFRKTNALNFNLRTAKINGTQMYLYEAFCATLQCRDFKGNAYSQGQLVAIAYHWENKLGLKRRFTP